MSHKESACVACSALVERKVRRSRVSTESYKESVLVCTALLWWKGNHFAFCGFQAYREVTSLVACF